MRTSAPGNTVSGMLGAHQLLLQLPRSDSDLVRAMMPIGSQLMGRDNDRSGSISNRHPRHLHGGIPTVRTVVHLGQQVAVEIDKRAGLIHVSD